jgi:hypothetical protein
MCREGETGIFAPKKYPAAQSTKLSPAHYLEMKKRLQRQEPAGQFISAEPAQFISAA